MTAPHARPASSRISHFGAWKAETAVQKDRIANRAHVLLAEHRRGDHAYVREIELFETGDRTRQEILLEARKHRQLNANQERRLTPEQIKAQEQAALKNIANFFARIDEIEPETRVLLLYRYMSEAWYACQIYHEDRWCRLTISENDTTDARSRTRAVDGTCRDTSISHAERKELCECKSTCQIHPEDRECCLMTTEHTDATSTARKPDVLEICEGILKIFSGTYGVPRGYVILTSKISAEYGRTVAVIDFVLVSPS